MSTIFVYKTNRYGIKKKANLEASLDSCSSILLNVESEQMS